MVQRADAPERVYDELVEETLQRQIGVLLYADRKKLREGDYEAVLATLRKRMKWGVRLGVAMTVFWFLDGVASTAWLSQSESTIGKTGIEIGTTRFWMGIMKMGMAAGIAAATAYTYGRQRDTCETVERLIQRGRQE